MKPNSGPSVVLLRNAPYSETKSAINIAHFEPEQDLWSLATPQSTLLTSVDLVVLKLPKFTDGRAYSQAVVLRQRLKYRGALRIVGDVLVDQVQALLRVGFNQIELRADQAPEVIDGVLGIMSRFYQQPSDPFRLNHYLHSPRGDSWVNTASAFLWIARKEVLSSEYA